MGDIVDGTELGFELILGGSDVSTEGSLLTEGCCEEVNDGWDEIVG